VAGGALPACRVALSVRAPEVAAGAGRRRYNGRRAIHFAVVGRDDQGAMVSPRISISAAPRSPIAAAVFHDASPSRTSSTITHDPAAGIDAAVAAPG
jgi:hypothetical protein